METVLLNYGPLGVMVVGLALWGLRLERRLAEMTAAHRAEMAAAVRSREEQTDLRIEELKKSVELHMEVRALLHALVREDR